MTPRSTGTERTRHALLSVSAREGLDALSATLLRHGWTLWASKGTGQWLAERGIAVQPLESRTGFAELIGGRVKTLDAKLHAAILARRQDDAELKELSVERFSLVVVNCYPFAAVAKKAAVAKATEATEVTEVLGEDKEKNALLALLEWIDIGGPAMLRAAAKNHLRCAPVPSPSHYGAVIAALDANGGTIPHTLARELAAATFALTAAYDTEIAHWFMGFAGKDKTTKTPKTPDILEHNLEVQELRYGENPHQRGWLYKSESGVAGARLLQGARMSYNNYADLDAAWQLTSRFATATTVIIKHTTPCAVATASTPLAALGAALATGDESRFGGVVACNRHFTAEMADAVGDVFLELIAAPSFAPEACEHLAMRRKNLRLLQVGLLQVGLLQVGLPQVEGENPSPINSDGTDGADGADGKNHYKSISGGFLVQSEVLTTPPLVLPTQNHPDFIPDASWKCVSEQTPEPHDWPLLAFAWQVAAATLSNAIIIARRREERGESQGAPYITEAIAGGRTSRLNAAQAAALAVTNATRQNPHSPNPPSQRLIAASDGFFPFPDGLEVLAHAGVSTIIQPGGSRNDNAVINAANQHKIALVLTNQRVFRH